MVSLHSALQRRQKCIFIKIIPFKMLFIMQHCVKSLLWLLKGLDTSGALLNTRTEKSQTDLVSLRCLNKM